MLNGPALTRATLRNDHHRLGGDRPHGKCEAGVNQHHGRPEAHDIQKLFLFVVMMLDINIAEMRAGFMRHLPVGVLVAGAMLVEMIMVVGPRYFGPDRYAAPLPKPADYSNTETLGLSLFTQHLYAFEIAAVILLVGIVAAIGLTMRRRPETKYQSPSRQVNVRARDRLRVVSMPAEERNP